MQRWIAVGVVVMLLFVGGGLYGYRAYKQNQPAPMWVPLPTNPDLPMAERDELIDKLKRRLSEPERLKRISKELGLPAKMELPDDAACAREIGVRMFVRAGEAQTPMGSVPAIHVGATGKAKEREVSGEIAMALMKEVWEVLGIEPPKGR